MAFTVKGYIPKENNKIISKSFGTLATADRYFDKLLERYNCQVEDEIIEGTQRKYFCNDRSSFIIETKTF